MTNQIDTSIQHVYHAVKQAKNYQKIEDAQKKLLDIEIMRLDIGKGTSKDVLEKEKELNEAKETKLKSLIYYQKALLALQVADGSLLKNFDINIAVNTE